MISNEIHIPSGFSPDGDGTNDTWVIRGLDPYPNNKVTIYNRWEIKVYERENTSINGMEKKCFRC